MGAVQRALGFFVGTFAVYSGLKGLDSLLYDFDERCDFCQHRIYAENTGVKVDVGLCWSAPAPPRLSRAPASQAGPPSSPGLLPPSNPNF